MKYSSVSQVICSSRTMVILFMYGSIKLLARLKGFTSFKWPPYTSFWRLSLKRKRKEKDEKSPTILISVHYQDPSSSRVQYQTHNLNTRPQKKLITLKFCHSQKSKHLSKLVFFSLIFYNLLFQVSNRDTLNRRYQCKRIQITKTIILFQ